MNMATHPTAIIGPEARIAPDAEVGPYAVIDGAVTIGPGVRIYPHAHLTGWTEIGAGAEIHTGAVVGHLPQDRAFRPCRSFLRIGARTIIREYATIHRGTQPESETVIGDECFLMAFSHVAHNCRIGRRVTICNGALLAGYVSVGDGAFISGHATVHQFVRIGRLAMIGGLARVNHDVPPFCLVKGDSQVWALNVVGQRRAGLPVTARQALRRAFRALYRSGLNTAQALEALDGAAESAEVREWVAFVRETKRGLCRYARSPASSEAWAASVEEDSS
jgi:UDP-N-acetylglucosamine acyltransferase